MNKSSSKELVLKSTKEATAPIKIGKNEGSCDVCWKEEQRNFQAFHKVKGKNMCIEHAHNNGIIVFTKENPWI